MTQTGVYRKVQLTDGDDGHLEIPFQNADQIRIQFSFSQLWNEEFKRDEIWVK